MPKGRSKVHYKGRGKRYLTEEEIRIAEEKKTREKEWKRKKGIMVESSESGEEEEGAIAKSKGQPGALPPSGTSGEEESSEEDLDAQFKQAKQKGVDGIIEVENPNRMTKKSVKAEHIDVNVTVELSRKEREEVEKQRSTKAYQKLHQAGKTDEARQDLARLALVRQQRAEAARKREEEKAKTAKQKV